jgi:flagellar L-ring protein FlgH
MIRIEESGEGMAALYRGAETFTVRPAWRARDRRAEGRARERTLAKEEISRRVQWQLTLLFASFLLLSGCMGPVSQKKPTFDFEKEMAGARAVDPAPRSVDGSLWSSRMRGSLVSDNKAREVGDVVTISIVESAKASKEATTKTARTSGLEASWSGVYDALGSQWNVGGKPLGTSHKVDFANNFDGQGATTRSSAMTAFITARVVHVLPNGNLLVRGSREVRLNNENQFIYLQGIIRPEDVSSSNVVLSTFVAEAVIEMNGQGSVSDKQRPGWVARALDWAWPF